MSGTLPTDPNPTLRARLMADLAIIGPQIRGLIDLRAATLATTTTLGQPRDLAAAAAAQLVVYQNRQALLQNVINDLNQAVVDLQILDAAGGWVALAPMPLAVSTFEELASQMADLEAAAATFIVASS